MPERKLRLIAVFEDGATSGLKNLSGELGKTEEAGKKSSSGFEQLGQGLNSVFSIAGKVTGAIVATGAAIDKALDLGEAGASVVQTADSFELLLDSVGAAPDQFEQLQAAAKGTVSDMTLMSSTATLLAGQSGELATQMANSSDEILEIAKAANKLNPTLGSTQFLYESLMTGIKRGSPLLIDNTGLTVKVGEANEVMAEALGKATNELTAEESKLALLNATLEAGNTLLNQVGGSTDSATDSFARARTSVENLKDTLLAGLAPVLERVAQGVTGLAGGFTLVIDATKKQTQAAVEADMSYEQYIDSLGVLGTVIKSLGPAWENYTREQFEHAKSVHENEQAIQQLNAAAEVGADTWKGYVQEQLAAKIAAGELSAVQALSIQSALDVQEGFFGATEAITNFSTEMGILSKHTFEALEAAESFDRVLLQMADDTSGLIPGLGEATITAQDFFDAVNQIDGQSIATVSREIKIADSSFKGARSTINDFWGSLNTNLPSSISKLRNEIDFVKAGGLDLQRQYEAVAQALNEGLDPDLAAGVLDDLFVAATNLQIELGNITPFEGAQEVAGQLGISLDDARQAMEDIGTEVDAFSQIDGEVDVETSLDSDGEQLLKLVRNPHVKVILDVVTNIDDIPGQDPILSGGTDGIGGIPEEALRVDTGSGGVIVTSPTAEGVSFGGSIQIINYWTISKEIDLDNVLRRMVRMIEENS